MIPREGQARLAPPCTVPRSDKADKRALLTKDSRRDKARNRSAVGVGTLNHPPTGPYSLFRVGASLLLHQDQEAPPRAHHRRQRRERRLPRRHLR